MLIYSEDKKYAYFNGLKFTKDNRTGYYLNSTVRERLHRAVWKYHNGEIPHGMQVHHKDHDTDNNDISNFELVRFGTHQRQHGASITEEEREARRKNMNEAARPKAVEWHKSAAGKEWHKKHYEECVNGLLLTERTFVCNNCGKEFTSTQQESLFCSGACRSAGRRKAGADNVTRKCVYCGNDFETNRYKSVRYCSRGCSNRANPRLPSLRKDKAD